MIPQENVMTNVKTVELDENGCCLLCGQPADDHNYLGDCPPWAIDDDDGDEHDYPDDD